MINYAGERHIEIGAQWIHGEGSNPVYQLALHNGLLEMEESEDEDDGDDENLLFYTQYGNIVPNDIVKETADVLYEILDHANKFSRENLALSCSDDSIGTYARQAFSRYQQTRGDDEHISQLKEALYNWKMLEQRTDNGCKSADELSLYSWGQYLEYEGDQAVVLKYGYDTIVKLLLAEIPNQCFHINTVVKRIQWTMSDAFAPKIPNESTRGTSETRRPADQPRGPVETMAPVSIALSNGEKLTADYVIFTGSVGVLKADGFSMFDPALPSDKQAVIERMGFGTVNKIYLEYDEPFWDKGCDGIELAWLPQSEPFYLRCLDNKHMEQVYLCTAVILVHALLCHGHITY